MLHMTWFHVLYWKYAFYVLLWFFTIQVLLVCSYDRIQPNTWSGAYQCWGKENREAPLRTACPPGVKNGVVSNFELKSFDGCANPHLGVAAIIASGIDGIRRLCLPEPIGISLIAKCVKFHTAIHLLFLNWLYCNLLRLWSENSLLTELWMIVFLDLKVQNLVIWHGIGHYMYWCIPWSIWSDGENRWDLNPSIFFFLTALFSSMEHISVTHCTYICSFIYWLSINRIVLLSLSSSLILILPLNWQSSALYVAFYWWWQLPQ